MGSKLRRRELEKLLFGEKLGEGLDRKVYVYNDPSSWTYRHKMTGAPESDPRACNHVIKVQKSGSGNFQNVAEWLIWENVRGTPMAKWFAPCQSISPCGLYLIQARVEPIRENEKPVKLPAFLTDFRKENFGRYKGRIVACDYGTVVHSIRTADKRLKKADWGV